MTITVYEFGTVGRAGQPLWPAYKATTVEPSQTVHIAKTTEYVVIAVGRDTRFKIDGQETAGAGRFIRANGEAGFALVPLSAPTLKFAEG